MTSCRRLELYLITSLQTLIVCTYIFPNIDNQVVLIELISKGLFIVIPEGFRMAGNHRLVH
jgi:hypothetical protein